MTDQTDSKDAQAREAVARALMDDSDVQTSAADGTAALARVDPKTLFCENWDTVRRVLEFVKDYLPKHLRPIVTLIIKAGDALKSTIC